MRAIASLSLSFGLVSIPVKLYSAAESTAAIRFKLMSRTGARLRQQYVRADDAGDVETSGDVDRFSAPAEDVEAVTPARAPTPISRNERVEAPVEEPLPATEPEPYTPRPVLVEREDMVKGYEFEKGKFVLFTPAELKALQEGARDSIDIVAFIPDGSVDPIYFDKAYLLAPDKRGEKTYSLLLAALQRSGRCALAKWAWRSKEYVVQVRAAEGGLVLQQLFYADEVRSLDALNIKLVDVGEAELKLAMQLIEQSAQDAYDPSQFVDEEKLRILAAVEKKIAGRKIVAPAHENVPSGQVIDLIEALRASLRQPEGAATARTAPAAAGKPAAAKPRKPARTAASAATPAPVKLRK